MPTQNINVNKGLVPEIQLFGDWNKALALFNTLPEAVKIGANNGSLKAAKKLRLLVRKNLKNNGPPGIRWDQLSPKYKKFKKRKGGNTDKIWYFKGTYYKNIKVMQKGNNIYVGVPAYKRSTINSKPKTLGQIANMLENGSTVTGLPARPLWKPTFKEFGGKNEIAKYITIGIRREVYLLTGYRPKVIM